MNKRIALQKMKTKAGRHQIYCNIYQNAVIVWEK